MSGGGGGTVAEEMKAKTGAEPGCDGVASTVDVDVRRGWSAIPTDVETLVFEMSAPRDRMVALERVCRWWRDESRRGVGWTTTFDVSSAAWRDFARLGNGESRLGACPLGGWDQPIVTFGDYLARLGARLSHVETFSNRGVARGALRRADEAAVERVLASPRLRAVEIVASRSFRIGRVLARSIPRALDRLDLSRDTARRPSATDDVLGRLLSELCVTTLVLERVDVPPDAYRRLAEGPAGVTCTSLLVAAARSAAPEARRDLGCVEQLVALRTLRLTGVTCVALPARVASSLRMLVCTGVTVAESCWRGGEDDDDGDDARQPFRSLTAFTTVADVDSRFVCSVLRVNAATLERLQISQLRRLAAARPDGLARLYRTLASCRFTALTSFGVVSASGIGGIWDALRPVLERGVDRLVQLILCDVSLDDATLVSLARIFNGRTTGAAAADAGAIIATATVVSAPVDTAAADSTRADGRQERKKETKKVLALQHLALAGNRGITAAGVVGFLGAVDLPHLAQLNVDQMTPLVFSATDVEALRGRFPALEIFRTNV